jgi:hypothetical protein
MTTTLLSLTDNILAAHNARLEEMKIQSVAEIARKHGYPLSNDGWYSDDFFSYRFQQMLVRLKLFVEAYNLDSAQKRMVPSICSFTIDKALQPNICPTAELGRIEAMLLEKRLDPSTEFAIWALSTVGLTARLAGDFNLDQDGNVSGSLWIEVE